MAASSFFLSLGNLPVLVGGLVAASLAWYVASAAATWFRLRRVPGPFLASFSSSWGVFKVAQAQMHRTVAELDSRYGPLVRIGPNELLLSDAATLWRMNAARSPYSRGAWYSVMKMDPYGHNIFSEPDNTVHDKRKAVLAGGFAGRGRMNFERDVDSLLAILVRLLKTKYVCNDGTKVLDLGQVMRYFTIDVTSLVGFGEAWGDLENERDTFNYLSALDGFGPAMLCISMAPILRRIFSSSLFLRLAGPKHTDETGMGRILGVTKKVVEERFSARQKVARQHEDVVDTWIRNGVAPEECEREINLLIPAGAETTTTVIRATFLFILSTPAVYRKLKDEITEGVREGRVSSPITNEEAKKLPYLQAVINEGIRMMPPLPLGFPKRVPPQGDTILDKFIPGGTDIFVNTLSLFRNKEVFGADADFFRPERFLECSSEKKALLLKHIDFVFGNGRWLCAGKGLAWMELNKIFVELLRRFDIQLLNPEKPWTAKCHGSWYIDGLLVRVTDSNPKS